MTIKMGKNHVNLAENLVHTVNCIVFLLVDDFCAYLRGGYILVS